jgi:hypothetical protein
MDELRTITLLAMNFPSYPRNRAHPWQKIVVHGWDCYLSYIRNGEAFYFFSHEFLRALAVN